VADGQIDIAKLNELLHQELSKRSILARHLKDKVDKSLKEQEIKLEQQKKFYNIENQR